MWRSTYESHSGNRRSADVAQRGAGQPRRHDGWRRLHQDFDRQGPDERYAPGKPGHGSRHPRICAANRNGGWFQAGRGDPHRKAVHRLAGHDERGTRSVMDASRTVPLRRERIVGRHRATVGALCNRTLFCRIPSSDCIAAKCVRDFGRARTSEPSPMSIAEKFATMEYGPAPEDPKEAEAWLERHGRRFGLFIGGAWQPPAAGEYFDTLDPSNGEKLAAVAQGGVADINAAVGAARAAFPKWRALTAHARARYLYALARLVQNHSRLLAVLETMDNGKPIRESRDIDIPLVARHFYYHSGWAQLFAQEFPGYEPCGVVGQIIPWNFPLLMLAWKIAPALATGNTVVLKPAEFTPLTALAFAELCQEAALPAGVVNIVTGDGSTGEALVRHPDVDKIAFTGSTEVGRAIRAATSTSSKRLSLELGGKSPFIVFEDADLDSTVEGLVDGIWLNQGQVCCAGSRLLMQESIAEVLITKIQDRMSTLRIGVPLDKAIDIGAIVAKVQLDRIHKLVDQGIADGATCWQPQITLPAHGFYYPPTLLSNVHPTSIVAQQEIFGPVLAAMTFRTPREAVELANNTVYGLASCVWSENINVALHVAA